jgi:hypothetical protein
MSLREIAARHRQQILASPMGLGEDIVHIAADTGIETAGRGVWSQAPTDTRTPDGIGAQGNVGRSLLAVAIDWIPAITRADHIRRVATGETWGIEQIDLTTGVGRRLTLARDGDALARGAG